MWFIYDLEAVLGSGITAVLDPAFGVRILFLYCERELMSSVIKYVRLDMYIVVVLVIDLCHIRLVELNRFEVFIRIGEFNNFFIFLIFFISYYTE